MGKRKEQEQLRRDDMAMLKRIEIENQKARDKEHAKLMEEKARAKELKDNLVKQLAAKAAHKKFEAEEERQLQLAAKKKAAMDEAKRVAALEELMERMKSKQKIGESIVLNVAAIAKKDEERALREQAAYDEKKRKEEANRIRTQQMRQKEVLESLESQLLLKQQHREAERQQRQEQAVLLAADAEKAHNEAIATMDAEHKKKQDYYKALCSQSEQQKEMRRKGVGMSANERHMNAKVLAKMKYGQ